MQGTQTSLPFLGFPSWFMKLEMMSLSGMYWMKVSATGKNKRRRAETAAALAEAIGWQAFQYHEEEKDPRRK